MGLFQKLFGGSPGARLLEQQLIDTYTSGFQNARGMSSSEARSLARSLMELAKKRSLDQGGDKLPPNFGDVLLQQEHTDPSAQQTLHTLRLEGATDADVRWWWNMNDLERCMMLEHDEVSRFMLFKREISQGNSTEQATQKVRKSFPIFGLVSDQTDVPPDDRPLPFELKDRINRHFDRPENQQHMRQHATSFSSMNAYIRSRIKAGAM